MILQFSALLASRVIAAVLQALVGVLFARETTPAVYGVVVAGMGVLFFWFVVCDLGIMTFLSRARASGQSSEVSAALRLNSLTSFVGGLLAAVACAVIPLHGDTLLVVGLVIITAALAMEKNVDTALSVPISDGNKKVPAVSIVGRRVVSTVLYLALSLSDVDPIVAYAGSYLGGSLFAQIQLRLYIRNLGLPVTDASELSGIIRTSSPFLLNNIAVQSRALDTALVGVTSSAYDSGLYAAASKLVSPFMLIPSTLTSLVLPHMTRAGLSRVRSAGLRLLVGALLLEAMLVPFIFLAPPLTTLVLGHQYSDAADSLRWMILGLPFVALASPLGSVLQAVHREKFVALNSVFFAILTLALIGLGAYFFGSPGAAAATGIAFLGKCFSLLGKIWSLSRTDSTN